ncbi:hypothetical protein LL912_06315 [Niabella sp. CC-SYL272]|uniref:hypothetical protein n=1 Tax=Niabella agricola TaxID=2891571 RepID=UPI001F34D06A|nr:hypothetical protein [Niabella agricola]MCF3108384.1 hypothetical protein [Niabella agricola]
MKQYGLLLLVTALLGGTVAAQEDTSKTALRKKYENSDIHKELKKKMATDRSYPDSIILAPLHFINTTITMDTPAVFFERFSLDVHIKTRIPDDYRFYISPFNGTLNRMQFYGGIQTASDGRPIGGGSSQGIGRGGIFSRWMERNRNALKTNGYYASSDAEGDFISVRNKVKWDKGNYRLTLYKSGYVPGKPVPDSFSSKAIIFSWGEYEHSWVTMEVEDLDRHEKFVIGSLAFPGKHLRFGSWEGIFLEQYGTVINFAEQKPAIGGRITNYKELPVVRLSISNIQMNGKQIHPLKVQTYHNRTHHPEQSKIPMPLPLLSQSSYNAKTGVLEYEVGAFQSWQTPSTPDL